MQSDAEKAMSGSGRRIGILVVGLGGNNGVTLLAGLLANQQGLQWEGPMGPVNANVLGCITQLEARGGTGGYNKRYGLARFVDAVVGGWDLRATQLGQALYESRVLDYDLVRQVREEMDGMEVMPGVWDPDFIGESQHATANHTISPSLKAKEKLSQLRSDIRGFIEKSGLGSGGSGGGSGGGGHVTVIWSASVERPSERQYATAGELLAAVEVNDPELSPSMLYAAAAALEGCSFVNGGSQNTLSPALLQMAEARGCYMLGTDFKAGQTKFKTAAVEYLRHLGLRPVVIASSNHLGNNDMLNLTARKTLDAKMRVKSDIFQSWEEDIDHQVRVMYTKLIGDEKRDVVEYTSRGFMGCFHTMLTYTRAMDSALCVPLMVDVAVWCDHFAGNGRRHGNGSKSDYVSAAPQAEVARALAYLFKVPEGGAEGSDPGFFSQMRALDRLLEALEATKTEKGTAAAAAAAAGASSGGQRSQAAKEGGERGAAGAAAAAAAAAALSSSLPPVSISMLLSGKIVCAGLGCLDMQLEGCQRSESLETPQAFNAMTFCPGGSCPQACTSLARLGVPSIAVTKLGCDAHGDELLRLMRIAGRTTTETTPESELIGTGAENGTNNYSSGSNSSGNNSSGGGSGGGEFAGVDCSCVVRDAAVQTSVAVLPIFRGGGRGCFVNLAANDSFDPTELLAALHKAAAAAATAAATAAAAADDEGAGRFAAFHFGYPHLLPRMQGKALSALLRDARAALGGRPLLSVDLNGVDGSGGGGGGDGDAAAAAAAAVAAKHEAILGPALPLIDLLHANLEEARAVSGLGTVATAEECARWLLDHGVGMVAITDGGNGATLAVTADAGRIAAGQQLASQAAAWVGQTAAAAAFAPLGAINANGAGDAFVSGLLVALAWRQPLSLKQALQFALLAALQRVDTALRNVPEPRSAAVLMADVIAGRLPPMATPAAT